MGPPAARARVPRRLASAATVAALLLAASVATAPIPPAAAQTSDEVAAALAALGGGTTEPAVAERLSDLLAGADPAVLPSDGLAAADPARVRATEQAWADVAPEWRMIGLELAERIAACRDDAQVEGCGDQLRARLWLRHAEELRLALADRLAEAASRGDTERVRLEAALLRARDRAVARLRLLEDCDAEQLRLVERSCEQLRDQMDELGRFGPGGQEGS